MAVIRAFIAISLTPEIQQKLEAVNMELKSRMGNTPVRWVAGHSIHLTLKFLGDVSPANLELLKKILKAEAAARHPFQIQVGELGAFPSIHRPRVIWVKVEAPPELNIIQHAIENETVRLGYAREERPFSPHLTLGRVSRNASPRDVQRIGETLEKTTVGMLGTVRVGAVDLYRSDLQPGGAVYTCLFSAQLASPSP
jgi:2'-5' RNA ligase